MQLARVIGNVVATRKEDALIGFKLLLVQEFDPTDADNYGATLVAVDTLGAGSNDIVLIARGGAARMSGDMHRNAPLDAAIIGIVAPVDVFA